MTAFKNHIEQILRNEVDKIIQQQGYFLEMDFCTKISEKYGFAIYIIRPVLQQICPELSLIRRHASDGLKKFYGLEIKGYPVMYILNE